MPGNTRIAIGRPDRHAVSDAGHGDVRGRSDIPGRRRTGTSLRVDHPGGDHARQPPALGLSGSCHDRRRTVKAAISDFIDPLEISQKDFWQDLSTGQRTDIPFIRLRSK